MKPPRKPRPNAPNSTAWTRPLPVTIQPRETLWTMPLAALLAQTKGGAR